MSWLLFLLKVLWAAPYTLMGLGIGGLGMLFGGRVRINGRTIEFYDGGIAWMFEHLPSNIGAIAMTLGHVILGRTASALDICRKHELIHVAQFERWGPFTLPAYYVASAFVWMRGGDIYRDNPFEREAYGDECR